MFQSLLYWISYSYGGIVAVLLVLFAVSILIILDFLFLSEIEAFMEQGLHSFNPYYTGFPILIKCIPQSRWSYLKFQSLLYWISYSYHKNNRDGKRSEGSFNPYYTGFPILILNLSNPSKVVQRVSILIILDFLFLYTANGFQDAFFSAFQSLLYWISYSYHGSNIPIITQNTKFQSLLYWISYSYLDIFVFPTRLTARFNPYYTGFPILIFKT